MRIVCSVIFERMNFSSDHFWEPHNLTGTFSCIFGAKSQIWVFWNSCCLGCVLHVKLPLRKLIARKIIISIAGKLHLLPKSKSNLLLFFFQVNLPAPFLRCANCLNEISSKSAPLRRNSARLLREKISFLFLLVGR